MKLGDDRKNLEFWLIFTQILRNGAAGQVSGGMNTTPPSMGTDWFFTIGMTINYMQNS